MTTETAVNSFIAALIAWIVFMFYISIRDEPFMQDAISIRASVLQVDKAR